jgi:hypothetical protein
MANGRPEHCRHGHDPLCEEHHQQRDGQTIQPARRPSENCGRYLDGRGDAQDGRRAWYPADCPAHGDVLDL